MRTTSCIDVRNALACLRVYEARRGGGGGGGRRGGRRVGCKGAGVAVLVATKRKRMDARMEEEAEAMNRKEEKPGWAMALAFPGEKP